MYFAIRMVKHRNRLSRHCDISILGDFQNSDGFEQPVLIDPAVNRTWDLQRSY